MTRFKTYKKNPSVNYRGLEIDRDIVQEFLNDVTNTPPCPECGHDLWRVIISPGKGMIMGIPAFSTSEDEDEDERGNFLAIAVVNCDHCGYVKNFTLRAVQNWINKRKAQAEADDD
ncbi:hypothetical protein [Stenotrophomonas maltophilia]|uniref:hypothetical protein n=1 Tax=Stenotrophomonas maltophilia TaxID=40324 RepID=UPI00066B1D09|nr:hypothetical protein [Stenotrophomonas maltophilia]